MYKQKSDKTEKEFTTIRIYTTDYDFLAKNVKYPDDMADTVRRLIQYVKKKMEEKKDG
jgi:hypothetical protein